MEKSLIVKNNIRIDAPAERVWEVLTKPEYIRIWDNLPEDFGDFDVQPTTVIEWPGYTKLTVVEFDMNKSLVYSLSLPITSETTATNVGYTYNISTDAYGHTWLSIEIGDFALIIEGEKYYNESFTFGETASQKIKELAERKHAII